MMNIKTLSLKLEAAIYNAEKEAEIYNWLAVTVPTYTGQFNKRLETWLNKLSMDKFGNHPIERGWGDNATTKDYPNVNFWMERNDSFQGEMRFSLSFHYDGREYDRHIDFGPNNDERKQIEQLRKSNQREQIYAFSDLKELTAQVANVGEGRAASAKELRQFTPEVLSNLVAEHDRLTVEVKSFNDRVVWPIGDDLRIK